MLPISMHLQNLVKQHPAFLKILSGNEILTSIMVISLLKIGDILIADKISF